MIINCPSCSTRFQVPPTAIPAGGRDVRCAKCAHTWHVMPEGEKNRPIEDIMAEIESLSEEAAQPMAPPPEFMRQPAKKAPPAKPVKSKNAHLQKIMSLPMVQSAINYVRAQKVNIGLGVVAFAALFALLLVFKVSVVSAMPSMAGFYKNVTGEVVELPYEKLIIERIETQAEGKNLTIKAQIVNMGSQKILIPDLKLKAHYKKEGKAEVFETDIPSFGTYINGEDSLPFNYTLKNIPEGIETLEFSFAG